MHRPIALRIFFCLALMFAGCVGGPSVWLSPEQTATFHPDKLREMGAAIHHAQREGLLPGGVLWVERRGVYFHQSYGQRSLVPQRLPALGDTIYDVASLTKVLATAPAVMLLLERGKLDLAAPVKTHLPEFAGAPRDAITLRHLLTHTSGLRPGISLAGWTDAPGAIAVACAEMPRSAPGTQFVYSDINFILLGEIVRRVSGKPLDEFLQREIYGPLKMEDTGFLPPQERGLRIAPTTVTDGVALRGAVHDPTARQMGGVAGHAGLFSTAPDIARFARMLLNGGELEGVRVLQAATVRQMIAVQTPPGLAAQRGLGWDIDTGFSAPRGALFPKGSFGHTGFTGTSMWMDPASESFVIFLSNRNHPKDGTSVTALRRQLGTLAAGALRGVDFNATLPSPTPP